jgi:hypothetical protein
VAGGQRSDCGGIRSLLELIDQHREAIEYDLIRLGLRFDWLGTEALSWRDLWVIVNQSPQGSALDRAMRPDEALWGLPEQLLAHIADQLADANWQRGGKGNRPERLPRPGVTPSTKTHGKAPLPMEEMREWLGWN